MKKIVLVTESGSDLPQKDVERYGIYVVPMHVVINEKTYDDVIEVKSQDVYDHYDQTGVLPTTSGSTPQDFKVVFDQIIHEHPGANIVYIAYSAVTTVSFNSARIAAEEYDNIYLVDSKNVSVGLGNVVIAAAKYIEENLNVTAQEVVAYVEDIRERTQFFFLPQTLTYLRAGGRVSNASYLGARLLKIFPTIEMTDGYLVAGKKYRGSFKKAYQLMIDNFFDRFDMDLETVRMVQTGRLSEDDQRFINDLLTKYGINDVEWIQAGAVISCHGGPGATGISGIEKG